MKSGIWAAATCVAVWSFAAGGADSIRVGFGHQSMCSDTYAGGLTGFGMDGGPRGVENIV